MNGVTPPMRLISLFLLAPALAHAEIAIVKGGPSGDGRALADGALGEAARAMSVCWRAPTSGPVRVAVAVAKDGAVTATAVTKGGAAQCAAGILAVWSIPGGAWKGEVEIGAGATAAPDLAATIQKQLLAASGSIKACQSKAPGKAGAVAIKLRIATDGSISNAEATTKLGADVKACVEQAVNAIRLAPTGAATAVSYQLAVSFSGGDGAPAKPAGGDPPPPSGSVSGALQAYAVASGADEIRDVIVACGGKDAKGKKAMVRFTVRGDGTVKNIAIKESSGVAKLDTCVKDAVAKARFPTASGETKVLLPIAW